jgi:hypothetical protein
MTFLSTTRVLPLITNQQTALPMPDSDEAA